MERDNAPPEQRTKKCGPRSRSGCWTCRNKKVKCDEERPLCNRCRRLRLQCDYSPQLRLSDRRRLELIRAQDCEYANHSGAESAVSDQRCQSPYYSSTVKAFSKPRPGNDLILASTPFRSTSSLILTNDDHEAIKFFRTSLAESHHTKNPKFSMLSIMFQIAKEDPMVMHMVLALGVQEIRSRCASEILNKHRSPLESYSLALGLMKDRLSTTDSEPDLDCILSALYLMLLYEEKFGDGNCTGLSRHLEGAGSILRHCSGELPALPDLPFEKESEGHALVRRAPQSGNRQLSLYSARVLTWLTLHDGAAAWYGVGGNVIAAVYHLLSQDMSETEIGSLHPLQAYDTLYKYSNPLYRKIWGDVYPQSELLDDVENRSVYSLLSQCGYLRFMNSQLASLYHTNPDLAARRAEAVKNAIRHVGYTYCDLLEVAGSLSMDTDGTHRLVSNLREIVPQYYAAVLDFHRLTRPYASMGNQERHALRELMNLAFQSFKHGGNAAMTRMSWPLFIAAIVTDDLIHRDWILTRFSKLDKYGRNFERAYRFLRDTFEIQDQVGKPVNVHERIRLGLTEHFVLSR